MVGPGEAEELIPPSRHHLGHVEAGQEADRNEVGKLSGVNANELKHFSEKKAQEKSNRNLACIFSRL